MGGVTVALTHDFYAIYTDQNGNITKNSLEIKVDDFIILYIKDSLKWIKTTWVSGLYKESIDYYGQSIISGEDLRKLLCIIGAWMSLFDLSTSDTELTGDFLIDEQKYERIKIKKEDLLKQLSGLHCLCKDAIDNNHSVLHIGI